ncbi:MAG: SLC13 family permease [Alphaproteobacteria bacterium]|nr:SLC13 family permease [Alphaproteobacteria bacterium]
MVVVIALTGAVMISFAWERVSLEMTSLALLVFLLIWFQVFPLPGPDGANRLDPTALLRGFANPSLMAVMALLVMGQAMVQTGALTGLTRMFLRLSGRHRWLALTSGFTGVLATSAFLNNTPVVVMFIPIMQALAQRFRWSTSRVMMPLSFAAILGGMTTLMGSSTNLLVSSALTDLGQPALGIFDFSVIGVCMAAVGAVYVIAVLPRLLPDRGGLAGILATEGKQFVAEIDVTPDSRLIGATPTAGRFDALPDVTVRVVSRQGHNLLPPFDDVTLQAGDVLIVAATRPALTEALSINAGYLLSSAGAAAQSPPEPGRRPQERVLAEVMIAPASRMIDQTIDMVGFHRRFGCLVLGIQRRGRMARRRMGEIRLEAGDVLLIVGAREAVDNLAANPDIVLMTWAIRDLPRLQRAPHAAAIFGATVLAASTGLLPISVAAIAGAAAMLAVGCLNLRQAIRALDRTIFVLVGAALALGSALQATGAAAFLANSLLTALGDPGPVMTMGALFVLVAIATNVLTNHACAVLFTPIAVGLAGDLGIDPSIMAITVVLAANCSFATPIGYQTNLLVMGPGHYRFRDFLLGGLPLAVVMAIVYMAVAPAYFGL